MFAKNKAIISEYSLFSWALLLLIGFYASVLPSDTSLAIYFIVLLVLFLDAFLFKLVLNKLDHTKNVNPFSLEHIEQSLASVVGRQLSFLFKTFFATIFYAFLVRHRGADHTDHAASFSYEKSSNTKDMFWVIAIAQIPTLPLIHLFIEKEANAAVAWAVTLLTGFSVIHYLAQIYAARFNPIFLAGSELKYRFGLSWSADIPIKLIKDARSLTFKDHVDPTKHFVSPLGSNKNVVLEFEEPIIFHGQFGIFKRKYSAVISVDNPCKFLEALNEQRNTIT